MNVSVSHPSPVTMVFRIGTVIIVLLSILTSCTHPKTDEVPETRHPAEIWDVSVFNILDTSATLIWRTNGTTTTTVEYFELDSQDRQVIENKKPDDHHSLKLTGLQPDTSYHVEVTSRDSSGYTGNISISPITTLPLKHGGPDVGNRAPDFALQTTAGNMITLSNYLDKITIVEFWNHACTPCEKGIRFLQTIVDQRPADELVVLTVHVGGDIAIVKEYMQGRGITFPVLLDSRGNVYNDFLVSGYPVTFFIDRLGIIRYIENIPFDSVDDINEIIDRLPKQ